MKFLLTVLARTTKHVKCLETDLVGEVGGEITGLEVVVDQRQTQVSLVVEDQVRDSASYQHIGTDVKLTAF